MRADDRAIHRVPLDLRVEAGLPGRLQARQEARPRVGLEGFLGVEGVEGVVGPLVRRHRGARAETIGEVRAAYQRGQRRGADDRHRQQQAAAQQTAVPCDA